MHRNLRPLWLPVLVLHGLALHAEELKLEQAIQLALQNNRDLANAALDVAKAGDRIAAFHTQLRPSFNFYGLAAQQLNPFHFTIDKGTLGTFPGLGPLPASNVNYSTPLKPTGFLVGRAAQPLSTLYRLRLKLKVFDIQKKLTEEQMRAKRQDIARDVKKLYYDMQQVESSLGVTRETIQLYREIERLTADYVAKQVALESEHLESQTRLAKAEQNELVLSDQEATEKEQLNQLLGRDVLTEFTVTPISEVSDSAADLAAARQKALDQRPELHEAKLKIEQSEQEIRAKRAEYIPDVSAEFNSISLLNFGTFLPIQSTSLGVSVSWDVFDWGRKKQELAEKQHTAEQNKNSELNARGSVIIDVDSKFRTLQQARAQFRVARLSQQTALEGLRVTQKKYEQQAVLLRDVLQGQANVEQANNDYQQALAKYWTAQAEFEHAIGEDQ
jgi:outer membrane protein